MSYRSAEWLSKEVVEETKLGKTRIKRFMEKPTYDIQWSEDEPFNPSFSKIDRIIDEGELYDEIHYLVKWCSLPYDECTWESQATVIEVTHIYNDTSALIYHLLNFLHLLNYSALSWTNQKSTSLYNEEYPLLQKLPAMKRQLQLDQVLLHGERWMRHRNTKMETNCVLINWKASIGFCFGMHTFIFVTVT
jgi:Chromo (CHRromatin Organisation MOdifier) domain